MKRKKINSDSERLKLITGVAAHAEIAHPTGTQIFSESHITAIRDLIAPFASAVTALNQAVEQRRAASRVATGHLTRLKGVVRGVWASIRALRLAAVTVRPAYRLYGLSATGKQPIVGSRRQWLATAKLIIDGDLAAEAEGLPVLVAPSRAVLAAVYAEEVAATETLESSILTQKEAQYRLQAVRGEVDVAIKDTVFELEIAFRRAHTPAKRDIMRLLGFRWSGDPPIASIPEAEPIPETVTR